MTSVFCSQNCVSLCPASFGTPRPITPPGYSRYLLTSFAFQSPMMKKISFWCQHQDVLQVFIESFSFIFLSIHGLGINLDYCDIEWFALEMNLDHSVIFDNVLKYCILDSFLTMRTSWSNVYPQTSTPLESLFNHSLSQFLYI